MEIEQKAALLEISQQKLEEARRSFQLDGQPNHEDMPGRPSNTDDFFVREKARNELIDVEKEQKSRLVEETLELRRPL